MKKLLIALLALMPILSQAQTFYYNQPATLTGKLLRIKSLHPNQEAFGGNQIALALDRQVNVDGEEGANSNMRCDSFKSLMIINKLSKFL
ncbi:hypothetical protein [Acinetobacter haemolyticus]|uniref:hypothetical protein n=1 Tax=Acinetobacter haemolyticus TaxID=29430 RepID=UPI001D17F162|nr:hypothetical protein [Acinetobacter haemolyticus]